MSAIELPAADGVRVVRVDYADARHARDLLMLLDEYARDAAGGGVPLSAHAREHLVPALAARAQAFSLLAYAGDAAVGLANCIEGFSTFAARPLVNVHDLVVLDGHRGRRIGQRLLQAAEQEARRRDACKLTLEVLTGNAPALRLYERFGFEPYVLDPALGQASFMHKPLAPA